MKNQPRWAISSMLPWVTVPAGLLEVLGACRGAFTAPGFATFVAMVVGALGAVGPRTVTGMWIAAGLADRLHWSRAHRFFSHTKWNPDTVGLCLAHVVVSLFVAAGAPIVVAVDDTLLHRFGRLVYGAAWQHDGSAKGRDGIGRGNCFVVVGLVVDVPFMGRGVLLPVLCRLHVPKSSPSKTEQARAMVNLLARALAGRSVHVVADALYRGPAWRDLPRDVTFTTRLHTKAVLYAPPPPPSGRRGHPAWKAPGWVRTCRRELLDRTLVWNQRHLLHALREFEIFCNEHRPHQGIANARPLAQLPEPITDPRRLAQLTIHRRDRLGGVLHEYDHAA